MTFDVASDAGRRAINNLLGEYGPRVLFTVYEIGADPVELDGIMWRAERHLRPGDHLLALPACGRCRTAFRGGQVETVAPTGWVVS